MKNSEIFTLSLPSLLRLPLEYLLGITLIRKIYRQAISDKNNIYNGIIEALNTEIQTNRREILKIPLNGACMVIANHPYGCIEGIAIMRTLFAIRSDVKIVATHLLKSVPEFGDSMIFVDPNESEQSKAINIKALKTSVDWLRSGGMLVVFPAGEVSLFSFKDKSIQDKEWHSTYISLALKLRCAVVPAFIHGSNSYFFQIIGLIHSKLKLLFLLHEFLRMRNRLLKITFGKPIPERTLLGKSMNEIKELMRKRVYMLQYKTSEVLTDAAYYLSAGDCIADPVSKHLLQANIDRIHENLLLTHGDFVVYYANYEEIPYCILEICRLRELSFRLAGEGTGQPSDSDTYDQYYIHVFIWDKIRSEIVGAYRIGKTNDIVSSYGIEGLYTSTLFNLGNNILNNSLELGRSFVHPEYQKSYLPLLLLWKGIAVFIAKNPRYRYLFGAVSISNEYSDFSKVLILNYLEKFYSCADQYVDIKGKNTSELYSLQEQFRSQIIEYTPDSLDDLHDIITNLEYDGKGIPPLVKHYIKIGGRFATFSTDKNFNNCIDALVVVDLMDTETTLLKKYMNEYTQEYYSFHNNTMSHKSHQE